MKKSLTPERTTELLQILQKRFEKNMDRHPNISWETVAKSLQQNPEKLYIINEMEETDGEPDVVILSKDSKDSKDKNSNKTKSSNDIIFVDCSAESPKGRRSFCYDQDALDSRKEHKPKHSAIGFAKEIGITLLNEEEYHTLQSYGKFDLKTSTWLATPAAVRDLGGAIFGDRRYNRVFIYHNGAESYYAARGFRGKIIL